MHDLHQIISKSIFMLLTLSIIVIYARPSHLSDNSQQLLPDQDPQNMMEPGYKQWQVAMLAQKLAELNQLDNGEFGFERSLRSGNEIKRQSRYRLCYFNPVSCFKK